MGEFRSQLFRNLADAAHITYDWNIPDDAPVFRAPNGKPIFTNADALRMDRMKTAIIRVLLLRACNFMRITQQDKIAAEGERCARAEFSFELRTTNIMHKNRPPATLAAVGGGAASRPSSSFSDVVDGEQDKEIAKILDNFIRDLDEDNPQLMFNCPPPPQ